MENFSLVERSVCQMQMFFKNLKVGFSDGAYRILESSVSALHCEWIMRSVRLSK